MNATPRRRLAILTVTIAVLATAIVLVLARRPDPIIAPSGIPLPFGTSDNALQAKLSFFGKRNGIDVYEVTFDNGELEENLQQDKIYLVHVPNDPAIVRVPVDHLLLPVGVDQSSVDYFCYRYADASALAEKSNVYAPRFKDRFPGEFCASNRARAEDPSHGGAIDAFERQNGVVFRSTDGSVAGVFVEPNTLFAIVVNEDGGAIARPVRTPPLCGDGVVQGTEACDDGDDNGTACTPPEGGSCQFCSDTCTTQTINDDADSDCDITDCTGDPPYVPSMQCDDGSTSGAVCAMVQGSCSWTVHTCTGCGDGVRQDTEECDDGNAIDDDACHNDCSLNIPIPFGGGGQTGGGGGSVCGNGTIESGETCDDENITSDDGCSNTCQVEAGYSCSGEPSVCHPGEQTSYGLAIRFNPMEPQRTVSPGTTAVPFLSFRAIAGAADVRLQSLVLRMLQGSFASATQYQLLVDSTGDGVPDTAILSATPSADGSSLIFHDASSIQTLHVPARSVRQYAVVADIPANASPAVLQMGLRTDAANVIYGVRASDNQALVGVRLDGSCLFGCDVDVTTLPTTTVGIVLPG